MKSTSLADASPFGAIPPTIATLSILPFLTSDDWLIFRLTSLDCYNLVHGTTNISSSYCPKCQWKSGVKVSRNLDEIHKILAPKDDKEGDDIDSEALWRLALIRDYQFDPEDNETAKKFDTTPVRLMSISFHSPAMTPRSRKAMVDENEDIFCAPTAFSSWKHYRKIDCRLFHATHFPSLKDVPSSARIVGPYFLRSALIFQKIRKSQGSECETNMSNGYLFDLRRLMKDSNYKVSALRAVYSFYSGQRNMNPGFFGGFSTLKKVVDMNWGYPFYTKSQFQVSGDSMGSNRTVYVDLKSGQVILGRKILNGSEASYEPVVNATPIMKDDGIEMHSPEDSFLRWMEEYSDRLANGFYSHGSLYASHDQIPTDRRTGSTLDIFRIIQFPSAKNTYLCSRSITRGVEVLASALFVPGAKSEYTTKDTNIYSIRIRIVTPEDGDEYESVRERGFETCQLVSWNLTMTPKCNSSDAYYDSEPVNYSGEGFFGHFPLLREGGYKKYFQYDSAEDVAKSSSLARDIGKGYYTFRNEVDACEAVMDGYLEFVPGSLHKPQGEIFHVVVAPFPLSNDTQGYFF